jgi:hypothetical protein
MWSIGGLCANSCGRLEAVWMHVRVPAYIFAPAGRVPSEEPSVGHFDKQDRAGASRAKCISKMYTSMLVAWGRKGRH